MGKAGGLTSSGENSDCNWSQIMILRMISRVSIYHAPVGRDAIVSLVFVALLSVETSINFALGRVFSRFARFSDLCARLSD